MRKRAKTVVCPRCSKATQRPTAHEQVCLADPENVARWRAEMDDGDGMAISRTEWQRQPRSVSDDYLSRSYGGWDNAARVLGLQPFRKGAPAIGLNAPLSEAERHACARRAALEADYHPSYRREEVDEAPVD